MNKISVLVLMVVLMGFSGKALAQNDKTRTTVTDVVGSSSKTSSDLKKLQTDSLSNWKLSGAVGLNSAISASSTRKINLLGKRFSIPNLVILI